MTHSPAPWRIGRKQQRAVLDANGSQIAVIPKSIKADAALIAAAPEMYKALVLAYMNPHNGYIDAICEAISKAEGRDNAFVNWFKIRRHARDFPEGDVNIPTQNGGLLKVSYAEIMERAAIWESFFESSKAEQSQDVPTQTETK